MRGVGSVTRWLTSAAGLWLVGAVVGALGAILQNAGNPANMGLCTAGFIRDIAGALGLHRTEGAQYLRPELIGLLLGAALSAGGAGELKSRGANVGVISVALGSLAMLGALAFHGCSMRAMLRMAGGDLTGPVGLGGFVAGVVMGLCLLRRGFSVGRRRQGPAPASWLVPVVAVGLLAFRVFGPSGAGQQRAPLPLSLGAGLVIGVLAQRSRFCTMGAFRNLLLMRDPSLLAGVIGTVVTAFVLNVVLGQAHLSFDATFVDAIGGCLGMALVGLASTLAGGCPTRQVILAGEGDGDAALFLIGMAVTAALGHNAAIFSSCGERAMDASPAALVLVVSGLAVSICLGLRLRPSGQEG